MEMVSVEFCHILRSSFTASAVITNTGRRIARPTKRNNVARIDRYLHRKMRFFGRTLNFFQI